MLYRISKKLVYLLILVIILVSCSKKDFLDKKPSTELTIPSTLADLQAILDNDGVMVGTPVLGELSADNFYLDSSIWSSLDTREKNTYTWVPDIFNGQGQVDDWNMPYKQVFYANTVLEGLTGIPVDNTNADTWNGIRGAALFIRAYAFYNIAQVFAPVYDSSTAATDPGIVLRLSSAIKAPSVRASVQATYDRVISDLQESIRDLPAAFPTDKRNRPSKPASYALMARVYLSMRAYDLAGRYADSCLQLYPSLIDYNMANIRKPIPFTNLNAETIYQSRFLDYTQVLVGVIYPGCVVDSNLYRSYVANDLRRSAFYRINANGLPNIKGSYNGTIFPFSGLATDEVYLIRAECAARIGNLAAALQDLNALLVNRWKNGTFIPVTASSSQEALTKILQERRKELAFRGLRWTDLRRLNKEGAGIMLTRLVNGQIDHLAPNSKWYTLPIPPDEIAFNPGMVQNPR